MVLTVESSNRQEQTVCDNFNTTTDNNNTTTAANMILARKVRVSLPDQSNFLLHTLGQFSEKPTLSQPASNNSVQRYFIIPEESEETSNSSGARFKLRSAVKQLAISSPNPERSTKDKSNSSSNDNTHGSTNANISSAGKFNLPRVKSSPQFSVLPSLLENTSDEASGGLNAESSATTNISSADNYNLPRVNSSPQFSVLTSLLGSSASGGSNIITKLPRNRSHGDFLEMAHDSNANNTEALSPSLSHDSLTTITDSHAGSSNRFGFGILSRTRQFGAWLTKAVEGDKVHVTKKDINTVAPNSF